MAAEAVVDLERGVLRFSRPVFETLVGLCREGLADWDPSDPALAALRAAGLVEYGEVQKGIATIFDTVIRPVVRLQVDLLGPSRLAACPGWVDADFAVLAVRGDDGLEDIRVADTRFLPARLASLLGLGPRPRPAATTAVPSDLRDVRLHWRVTSDWSAPAGGSGSRIVEAVDGGDGGWWVVRQPEDDAPEGPCVLTPSSGTDLWRGLVGLLPTDDELRPGP